MLVSEQRVCSISSFILILIGYNQIYGTVTIDPTTACVGDRITIDCSLTVPAAGDIFSSLDANYIVGDSDTTLSPAIIGSNAMSGGVDLTKLMSVSVSGNSTFLEGRLILLSYLPEDNNTRLGCGNEYRINGNSANRDILRETINVIQAGPPSPPTVLSVSLTSLSPATCSGSVSVAWTPGASDRSIDMYFLFLNGDLLTPLNSSVDSHSYSINIATDTVYTYSVTANSCAGNSTPSNGVSISVESYSLVNSPPLFLTYDQSTSLLTVEWGLVAGNLSLLLAYSLQLNYSHSQYGTTYELNNSSSFSLLSNITLLTLLQIITPHNFSTTDGVVTNITACISITSQCGMPFYGDVLCGDFNSANPPTSTQPTQPTATISELTSTSPTVTADATPTQPQLTIDSVACFSSIIISVVMTVILMSIIFFSIITILVVVIVYLLRKIKQLQSLPKQTPHPYEYLDLNMVSPDTAAIPSVPKESAYYTPMLSVGTQGNSNVVPPVYANLK